MLDRLQLHLAVGHADVAAEMAFYISASYFHSGEFDRSSWKDVRTLAPVTAPVVFGERAFVVVEGDVEADVVVPDGGAVVVYGHVKSSIQMTGQCELVVAGDVFEGACVSGDGISKVFVGGDFAGSLRSRGSCKAWVQGSLRGQVWTGHPSTSLRVAGDCTATIQALEKASLLYLEVDGFMAYGLLEATAAVGYTLFNASVGQSDRAAGFYPDKAASEALRLRATNRWVVRKIAEEHASERS